jgi:hypothetical protein
LLAQQRDNAFAPATGVSADDHDGRFSSKLAAPIRQMKDYQLSKGTL